MVNLTAGGTYRFDLRAANSQKVAGSVHLEVDGVNVTGAMPVTPTGGNQVWTTLTKAGLSLTSGLHMLKLVMDVAAGGGLIGNFNWLKLTNTAVAATPA